MFVWCAIGKNVRRFASAGGENSDSHFPATWSEKFSFLQHTQTRGVTFMTRFIAENHYCVNRPISAQQTFNPPRSQHY